jgi:hypothetical protein
LREHSEDEVNGTGRQNILRLGHSECAKCGATIGASTCFRALPGEVMVRPMPPLRAAAFADESKNANA